MSDRLQTPRLLLLDLRANHRPGRFVAPGPRAAGVLLHLRRRRPLLPAGRGPATRYALWYPLLAKRESHQSPGRLKNLGAPNWLRATLEVKAPARDGIGLHGSGMFIINPPWTLETTLHDTLPSLTAILAQTDGARYTLENQSA